MTTTFPTTTTITVTAVPPARPLRRSVKAEWTKLQTHRSTWRTVALAVATSIGLGTAVVAAQMSSWSSMTPKQRAEFDPTAASIIGLLFAAVLLGALGVRTVTSEYTTGMIRATFAALPGRRSVAAAKAIVVAALAFPICLACNVAGFMIGQRILTAKHGAVGFGHPGVITAIVFGAGVASLIAVIGVGLGGVLRNTAAATTALCLILIGGAMFGQFLPVGFAKYLPEQAAQGAVTVRHTADVLRPLAGVAVLGIYAAVALGLAAVRMANGDA
jgi:ABC-2 type transport system permease protein